MFSRVSMSSMVVALSLAAAVFGAGCAAAANDDTANAAGAQSVPAASLARSYQGTIGTLKVMARLQVVGNAVSGSYFYADKASNGDAIVLSGNAVGQKLTFSEAVNASKTGSFDTMIGNGVINGTWKSPDGATSLAVKLTAVKGGTLLPVTRTFKDTAPAASASAGAPLTTCESTASFIEVFGLASAAAEDAINKKLAPTKIERDASGKCDSGSATDATQTVGFNAQGFLSIAISTNYDGGAHPEVSLEFANFKTADGSQLSGKDFFAADAKDQVKALVVKSINADASLAAADKTDSLSELDNEWQHIDSLDSIEFGITDKGLRLDMTNNYPHVVVALAPVAALSWADLKPLLKSDSPILPLVK